MTGEPWVMEMRKGRWVGKHKSRSKQNFTTPYNVLLNIKYHILFSTSYVHLFLIFQYSDIYKAFAQVNTKYEMRTKGNLGGRLNRKKGIRSLGGWD